MKTITVELSEKGIRQAVKKLKRLEYEKKLDEICERLADIAVAELQDRGYSGSISVRKEKIDNGYQIIAEGQGLYFLEYGTGIEAGKGEILGTPPVSTEPGSYSETHAQTFQKWVETGQPSKKDGTYLYEHPSKSGMYFAFKAMRDNVYDVARSVFDGDN